MESEAHSVDDPSGEITWIFSAEVLEHKTPSREDGISSATERRYRREGARFIINASNTLKLRRDTLATGAVFYHRFFMVQSFKDFDRWVIACTCMLLAGKVEETPKQCKSIIKVAQQLLTPEQRKAFGNNPKEELLCHERVLLQTIRFDLQVHHPYDYLLQFAQSLKGEKAKIEPVLQMAWTFINDSLCTTLCLQWEPPAVAVAMLYLAGKLSKFDLQAAAGGSSSSKRSWWRQFVGTVDVHDLESICHQVLDVYSEEEKIAKQENEAQQPNSQSTATSVGNNPPPLPPPPPPTMSTHTHLVNHSHLPTTAPLPYTAPPQSMGSQIGHTQQTLVPQQRIVNTQSVPGSHLGLTGTLPSVLGAYQPVVGQTHHHQPANSYPQQPIGSATAHYQAPVQMHHAATGIGMSHYSQVGGAGSLYTSGMNPSPVLSIPGRGTMPHPQPSPLYPGSSVMPQGTSNTLHSSQSHHHQHQHQQTYHSASGNWR